MKKLCRFSLLTAVAVVPLLSLSSCSRPIPSGTYRIEVAEATDDPTSITRKYLIETTSLRTIRLVRLSDATSSTLAPDPIYNEVTGKAELAVTVTLSGSDKDAHVEVATVFTRYQVDGHHESTIITRAKETLATPGAKNLKSLLTENRPSGNLTGKITLLRVAAGDEYVELTVE